MEYIATDAKDAQTKDFLATYFPRRHFPRFAVESALKRIDELGAQGWELVHMEPVDLGENGDIRIGGGQVLWTNTYFCVFKRLVKRGQV
jgi:hypothetical protein